MRRTKTGPEHIQRLRNLFTVFVDEGKMTANAYDEACVFLDEMDEWYKGRGEPAKDEAKEESHA